VRSQGANVAPAINIKKDAGKRRFKALCTPENQDEVMNVDLPQAPAFNQAHENNYNNQDSHRSTQVRVTRTSKTTTEHSPLEQPSDRARANTTMGKPTEIYVDKSEMFSEHHREEE
jgi:hypothetical protein